MKFIRHDAPDYAEAILALDRSAMPDPAIAATVQEIISQIRSHGDAALIELTARFGGPTLTPDTLRVHPEEIQSARDALSEETRAALQVSHTNVAEFSKRSLRTAWHGTNAQGTEVGERFDPFQRVGIYVPGGTAPLVSTSIMTATLAHVAGVPEIVVTTPAGPDGTVNPDLLAALDLAGVTEIYKVGGAQAVAALAFGTPTIQPVAKIFGPGNAYVVEAKRQCFGQVAIDLLPGPSEILILADDSANPRWVAADVLAQAEHGTRSMVGVLSPSESFLNAVQSEIESQFNSLSRKDHLRPVLEESTWLVLVPTLQEGVQLVNQFAPEHLAIMTHDDDKIASEIFSAGAIFLGNFSPVAGGDFMAGPSHELPTGGAGKSFPGLTADMFQKRTSLVRFSKESLQKSLATIETFGKIEGLDAHARSASIRFDNQI